MKENGSFNDFNNASKRPLNKLKENLCPIDVIAALKDVSFEASFPKICNLLTETTAFYEENFGQLQELIKREKRKLEFETPNRVLITHEYTLQNANQLNDGQYFLFNTTGRLAWLKIYEEGKHVCIASKQEVCEMLRDKLQTEVKSLAGLLKIKETDLLSTLYEASDGKPCFVSFEKTNTQAPLLKVEYYDSLNANDPSGCSFANPIIEKTIEYNYRPVHGQCSCWLYVKAPNDFHVVVTPDSDVETTASPDSEIYTGVWRSAEDRTPVLFSMNIKVPSSLNVWYKGIYYLSVFVVLFIGFLFFMNLLNTEVAWVNRVIGNIPKGIYALVATLITTRGWLMREEYVLGKLSKYYTVITFALIIEAVALSFCDTSNNQTKDVPVVELENNPKTSAKIRQESEYSIVVPNKNVDTTTVNIDKVSNE